MRLAPPTNMKHGRNGFREHVECSVDQGYGSWYGGAYSLVDGLNRFPIDHAPLPRRSTVPTPNSLTETPPTFGRSVRFFHALHKNKLMLFPSCLAVGRHHLSLRIAIVSRSCLTYQNFPCNIRQFSLSPPLTHSVPPRIVYILPHNAGSTIVCFATWTDLRTFFLLHPTTGIRYYGTTVLRYYGTTVLRYLFLLSGKSRSPTQNHSSSVSA